MVVARFALTLPTNLPLPAGEGRGEGQNFPDPTFSKTDVEILEVTIPSGLTGSGLIGLTRTEVNRGNPS